MTPGWEALTRAVEEAGALVAAAAPDAETAVEGEAYVARVVAAGLGGAVLGHLFRQDGLSRALPCYGGPNPDYIMRFTPVGADAGYRLEGRLNDSERVGIGLYSYDGPNGAPLERGYAAFQRDDVAPDGSFDITLGSDAGAGGLPIPPEARVMLARVLHRDPPGGRPADLRLVGGAEQRGLTLATGSADGALAFVARSTVANVREYLKWTEAARQLRNRIDTAPAELTETVQGDRDTRYFLGGFDLAPDECLEVTMPAGLSRYWSLHAYNYWYEHLQTPGVGDADAVPDGDGRVRITVGPALPEGMANRIDTLGRRKGALVCRIIGGGDDEHARPQTRLVQGEAPGAD